MAWRRRWWGGGNVVVSNPFLLHRRHNWLSVQDSVVRSRMSKQSSIHVWWSILTASSRSQLVTWPSGSPQDTRCAVMSAGKCARRAMGCAPAGITAHLVSWGNPEGQVANSDLELAVRMLHHACMEDCFDIRERTTLSRTDNPPGLR